MKNIIFDIGNVLLLFRPDEYLNQYYDEKTKGDLMTIIFSSDEWIELDLGNLNDLHKLVSMMDSGKWVVINLFYKNGSTKPPFMVLGRTI